MNANVQAFNPNVASFNPACEEFHAPCEPSYKQKEKTELCKFFKQGERCPFGDKCAYAHGEHELVKKTHVASKYKMTVCKSHQQGHCAYGHRCQFAHLDYDFSAFHDMPRRYQVLVNEIARVHTIRDQQADNAEFSEWDMTGPSKGTSRLQCFRDICGEEKTNPRQNKARNQKTFKNCQDAVYSKNQFRSMALTSN